MTDNLTQLHTEAKGATLNAIAAASAKVSTLVDEQRFSDIVSLSEGMCELCRGFEALAEAERIAE